MRSLLQTADTIDKARPALPMSQDEELVACRFLAHYLGEKTNGAGAV